MWLELRVAKKNIRLQLGSDGLIRIGSVVASQVRDYLDER
jgi:hypothetical protein